MPLDASIYGQLDTQAPMRLSQMLMQHSDPMAQAQKVMALKAMIGQGKMQDMQMRSAQADSEETANLRRLLSDPSFNRSAPDASAKVMAVAPVKGASILDAWQKGDVAQSTIAENRAKAADLEQKNKLALLEHMSSVAGTMKDQKSYERGAMYLASLSPTLYQQVQQWPTQHDPSFVSQLSQQSISAKDKMAQALQERKVDSEIANRLASQQTARGNLDVAKGNLGVSMANLGLNTDRLAIERSKVDQGKALPNAAIADLAAAGNAADTSKRLKETFKPDYAGKTILGDFSNTYKRLAGDETGQAQWWQDMDAYQNQTRHALFGSALTATELAAWNKTSITPRMNPTQIEENLNRRQQIEAVAASKLARAYKAGGYNEGQIRELLGSSAGYIDAPASPVGGSKQSTPAPARATMQQITETARRYGKTVDEVIRDARAKGIEVR